MTLWIFLVIILFPIMLVTFMPIYFSWKAGVWTYENYIKLRQRPVYLLHEPYRPCKLAAVILAVTVGLMAFLVGIVVNLIVLPVFFTTVLLCMVPYYFFHLWSKH